MENIKEQTEKFSEDVSYVIDALEALRRGSHDYFRSYALLSMHCDTAISKAEKIIQNLGYIRTQSDKTASEHQNLWRLAGMFTETTQQPKETE